MRQTYLKRLLLFFLGALTALLLSQSGRGVMLLQRLIRTAPFVPLQEGGGDLYNPFRYSSHYGYLLSGLDAVCSGHIEGNYFITAKHCTDFIGVNEKHNRAQVLVSDDFSNSKVYETVFVKAYEDVAILRFIEFKGAVDRQRMGGAEEGRPVLRRGEQVYVVLGGFGMHSKRQTPYYVVRSYKVIGVFDAESIGVSWYKGDALLLEGGSFAGCSGSPVFTKEGVLIGVVSGGVADFTIVSLL